MTYPPEPETVRVCTAWPDCDCNEYLPWRRLEGEPAMYCINGHPLNVTISLQELDS